MLPNIRFELKSDKTAKKKLVYAMISYKNRIVTDGENPSRPLKYSTSLNIEPRYWNKKKQRAKKSYVEKQDIFFNVSLDKLVTDIETIFYELRQNGHTRPTYNQVRAALNVKLKMQIVNKSDGLINYAKKFIQIKKRKDVNKKSSSTIEKYEILLIHLKDYAHEISSELLFSELDSEVYIDFLNFIDDNYIKKMGYGYAANTLNGKQKKLNAILNKARKDGHIINFDFQDRELKKSSDKVNHPYLTFNELIRIKNLDLSVSSKSMKQSAFFILVMATTGLRYSDLNKLSSSTVKHGQLPTGKDYKYIELVSSKTNNQTVIPILAPVFNYLISIENTFPVPIASQTMNNLIKKIALKAMVNEEIILEVTRTHSIPSAKTKKWEHISCHTGRRSFISNFAQNVPESVVSMITHPHHRTSMFDVYNKISLIDNVKLFFQYIYEVDEYKWLVDYSDYDD